MKRISLFFLAMAFCGLSTLLPANGQVIVLDHFTGANGTSINGRTPDTTNLPGRTFTTFGIFGEMLIDTGTGTPTPAIVTTPNSRMYIDISSNGGYVKPSLLTISADIQVGTADDSFPRGVGLGFFSSAPSGEASTNFTGLRIKSDGTLNLVLNGTPQAASVGPFPGWSTSLFYNLSYTINTSTGSIISVNFNGNDDTAAFSGATTAGCCCSHAVRAAPSAIATSSGLSSISLPSAE